MTLILVVLDPREHRATIVNAGHMAPMLRRTSGKIEEPGGEIAGIPLGISAPLDYQQCEIEIAPGETLTLFTDGINESVDANQAYYSIDRLRGHVRKIPGPVEKLGQTIVDDVRRFMGKAPQADDMCLVCFGRTK